MISAIILCLLAYFIGSISSAILVCRAAGLPDPRSEGSKNPGATNVMRLGGKKLAAVTLSGDMLKGIIPVCVALMLASRPEVVGAVMIAAFLGHLYPIYFGFQGGKGVATALGAITALSLPIGLLFIATWGIMAYFFRISSLAALTATLLLPLYTYCLVDIFYVFPISIICLLLLFRHRSNIQRLLKGMEPRFKN